MDTETSEVTSLEEAYDLALSDIEGEETPVEVESASPADDAVEDEVEVVESTEEGGDQPDSEGIEEEGPSKLSDLAVEETEPVEVEAPSLDEDGLVDVPDHGQVSLKELRDGYLRQADYTQKTQKLADQRREAEQAVALWDMLQEDAVGTIAQMAVRAGIVSEDAVADLPAPKTEVRSEDAPQEADIEQLVAQKVQEVLQSTPEIAQLRQDAATQRVTGELDRLENDYGMELDGDDRVAIVKTAISNREGLELTFLKMKEKVDKLNAEKDRVVRSTTRVRSTKISSKEVLDKPATVEEAYERAVAELS